MWIQNSITSVNQTLLLSMPTTQCRTGRQVVLRSCQPVFLKSGWWETWSQKINWKVIEEDIPNVLLWPLHVCIYVYTQHIHLPHTHTHTCTHAYAQHTHTEFNLWIVEKALLFILLILILQAAGIQMALLYSWFSAYVHLIFYMNLGRMLFNAVSIPVTVTNIFPYQLLKSTF